MRARSSAALAVIVDIPVITGRPLPEFSWVQIALRAPQMASTMARYLDQLAVSARPSTVTAVDLTLRQFAECVTVTDPDCHSVALVRRAHFEDYKRWLARRPGRRGTVTASTICRTARVAAHVLRTDHRVGLRRSRPRPDLRWRLPNRDEPLPKFLDDPTAAKFMATVAADPNTRRRLMVELLARTGIRSGELAGLDDNAMVLIGDTHWLRIPVGKLHNDRYVPLLPFLVELINEHRTRRGPARSGRLVERDDGHPFDRRTIHRYVTAVAKRAGVGHVHPHQLRHTLATQAINRGMSLEAIAALLGHRSMKMTLTYARITDRTVADEYFRVTAAVEADHYAGALPAAPPATP
jgi:integrase